MEIEAWIDMIDLASAAIYAVCDLGFPKLLARQPWLRIPTGIPLEMALTRLLPTVVNLYCGRDVVVAIY